MLSLLVGACAPAPTVTTPPPTVTVTAPAPTPAPAPTVTVTAPAPKPPPTPTPTSVSAADFYKDKRITMYVAYAPGGGVDYTARIFASFWTATTGGAMVVENKPGAGGLAMANFMSSQAKRDGSELGATSAWSGLTGPWVMKDPSAQYDLPKFSYLGSFGNEASAFAIAAAKPYASLGDVQKVTGFKLGALTKTGVQAMSSAILIKILGLNNARVVVGYSGTADLSLAAGRGEIDGMVYSVLNILTESKKGYFKTPLLALDYKRSTVFPDTPAITELMKVPAEDQKLLDAISLLKSKTVFLTPPDVPQDRVDFLRATFDKIVANDAFLVLMKRYFEFWTPPVNGVEEAKAMADLANIPRAEFDTIGKLLDQYAGQ
ncbi:MAG: hypothetical protein HY530_03000 [Chloroflexi bacterium]|nr:hypothetical protein [Chloroflexota bacterium]